MNLTLISEDCKKPVVGQQVKWLSMEEGLSRRKQCALITINHNKEFETTVFLTSGLA